MEAQVSFASESWVIVEANKVQDMISCEGWWQDLLEIPKRHPLSEVGPTKRF